MASLCSPHLSKAGGWSPPRFVSAQWRNGQHNDCRWSCVDWEFLLPIISQHRNLTKPKSGKEKKTQTKSLPPFCVTTVKSHPLLPGMLLRWVLKHTYGDIGGTWRISLLMWIVWSQRVLHISIKTKHTKSQLLGVLYCNCFLHKQGKFLSRVSRRRSHLFIFRFHSLSKLSPSSFSEEA